MSSYFYQIMSYFCIIVYICSIRKFVLYSSKLLRVLLDNLKEKDAAMQVIVLQILTEIFKNDDMKQCWCKFVELLTLRVLSAHCENAREVRFLVLLYSLVSMLFHYLVSLYFLSFLKGYIHTNCKAEITDKYLIIFIYRLSDLVDQSC